MRQSKVNQNPLFLLLRCCRVAWRTDMQHEKCEKRSFTSVVVSSAHCNLNLNLHACKSLLFLHLHLPLYLNILFCTSEVVSIIINILPSTLLNNCFLIYKNMTQWLIPDLASELELTKKGCSCSTIFLYNLSEFGLVLVFDWFLLIITCSGTSKPGNMADILDLDIHHGDDMTIDDDGEEGKIF